MARTTSNTGARYLHWQRNKLTQEERDARFFGRSTSPNSKGLYRYNIDDRSIRQNDKGRAGYYCQMIGR